jgi:hypothetical protein
MRYGSEATSIHLIPGLFGLRARLRSWKHALFQHSQELHAEMVRARRAAGTSGWWSDIPDGWPEEEFRQSQRALS